MPIDPAYLEQLRARYAFQEWQTGERDDVAQELDAFRGRELPGWTLVRTSRRTDPDGVPVLRGIWSRGSAAEDRVLDVEVWQLTSPATARAFLLSVLGDMQGPLASRMDNAGPGDVAFRLGGDSLVAFARGRVVARLRNAGRQVAPVAEEAAALDAWLQQKP